MKKRILPLTLALFAFRAAAAFAQDRPATDTGALPLNLSTYAGYFGFQGGNVNPTSRYCGTAPLAERRSFSDLAGNEKQVDTPLEFALLSYYSQPVVNIRPVDAQTMLPARNKTSETQLAAWSAIELAVLRFTNPSSPSIGKYEGILHFIKGRQTDATSDDITQNEINAAVRQIVSAEVDAQFYRVEFFVEDRTVNRGYNAVLTRDARNQYVLSYEGYFNGTKLTKTLSGTSLDNLLAAMSSPDFNQNDKNELRAQAGNIPAVRLGPAAMDDIKVILATFYESPNVGTYAAVAAVYALYSKMDISTRAATRDMIFLYISNSYVNAISSLNEGLAQKVFADTSAPGRSITLSSAQQQRLLELRQR
jgi:hypothetical protein